MEQSSDKIIIDITKDYPHPGFKCETIEVVVGKTIFLTHELADFWNKNFEILKNCHY